MKVLFLDIDGVCNSREFARRQLKQTGKRMWLDVDPVLVKRVQKIIKKTGCSVVLCSTWRLYPESREAVRKKVCRFMDCTPDLQEGGKYGNAPRGQEIKLYLDKHPEITHYAILDDGTDFLPYQWVFKTEFSTGVTEDIAEAVIDHLNAEHRI